MDVSASILCYWSGVLSRRSGEVLRVNRGYDNGLHLLLSVNLPRDLTRDSSIDRATTSSHLTEKEEEDCEKQRRGSHDIGHRSREGTLRRF
jgi:hypothetical protein